MLASVAEQASLSLTSSDPPEDTFSHGKAQIIFQYPVTICILSRRLNRVMLNFLPLVYCKFPKYSDTQKVCCSHSKIWTMWLYHRVMSPNDADGMANSVDPDQTAPLDISVRKLRIIRIHMATHEDTRLEREEEQWQQQTHWLGIFVEFMNRKHKLRHVYKLFNVFHFTTNKSAHTILKCMYKQILIGESTWTWYSDWHLKLAFDDVLRTNLCLQGRNFNFIGYERRAP